MTLKIMMPHERRQLQNEDDLKDKDNKNEDNLKNEDDIWLVFFMSEVRFESVSLQPGNIQLCCIFINA